jgi:hypothetical protein
MIVFFKIKLYKSLKFFYTVIMCIRKKKKFKIIKSIQCFLQDKIVIMLLIEEEGDFTITEDN